MDNVFVWFGANPAYYYLIALAALFSFVTLAAWTRPPANGSRFEIVFFAVTFLALFACRWPVFLFPLPLNPDEPTWAAGALKATVDFAPWRGFNPGTSGPLNAYVLAFPALVGGPITFASGRIIATCLMGAAMLALYHAVKWTNGERLARLAILPPVLLLSLTVDGNFLHYSSEHLSICLTTIALAATAYLAREGGSVSSRVTAGAVAGLCLGSTLFAKLQAVPIAFLIFIFAVVAVLSLWRRSRKEARFVAIVMLVALCAVPGVILVSLWWMGEFHDAYVSYIRMNLAYIGSHQTGVGPAFFFRESMLYAAFLVPSLIVIFLAMAGLVAAGLVRKSVLTGRSICSLVASILLLLTALFVIYRPHHPFAHYLLFSIVPLSFCVASALGVTGGASFWKNRESLISVLYAALFVLPALSAAIVSGNQFIKDLAHNVRHRKTEAGIAISRYAKPGDPMSVWGLASEYYVQTATYPATREVNTEGFIRGENVNYFRQRYLSDFQKGKPVVFVDAVGPGAAFELTNRASQGHEIFPDLDAYIREHYELAEDVGGVRIYVRKLR